jgi:hypothetical protein
MNYARLALATLGATVAYFALGGVFFTLSPLRNEFSNYPPYTAPKKESRA